MRFTPVSNNNVYMKEISATARRALEDMNNLDIKLYHHALAIFERRLEECPKCYEGAFACDDKVKCWNKTSAESTAWDPRSERRSNDKANVLCASFDGCVQEGFKPRQHHREWRSECAADIIVVVADAEEQVTFERLLYPLSRLDVASGLAPRNKKKRVPFVRSASTYVIGMSGNDKFVTDSIAACGQDILVVYGVRDPVGAILDSCRGGQAVDIDAALIEYNAAVVSLGRKTSRMWWKLRAFEYTRRNWRKTETRIDTLFSAWGQNAVWDRLSPIFIKWMRHLPRANVLVLDIAAADGGDAVSVQRLESFIGGTIGESKSESSMRSSSQSSDIACPGSRVRTSALVRLFAPFNAELEAKFGINVDAWTYSSSHH